MLRLAAARDTSDLSPRNEITPAGRYQNITMFVHGTYAWVCDGATVITMNIYMAAPVAWTQEGGAACFRARFRKPYPSANHKVE